MEFRLLEKDGMVAKLQSRYAEPAPKEPRDHREFERFIRELDSGQLPPCRPVEKREDERD